MNTDLNIKVKGMSNRINSEINNLFNRSDYVSSERKGSSISLKIKKGKNTYDLDLPSDYPFKSPINIFYNGINYKKNLSDCPKRIQKILKTKYYINCFCCDTIIYGSIWTPSMNTSHIINEIDKIQKIKKEVIIILLCDEIRKKYMCLYEFANFEKYLFSTF
jgi:hypothetical protein